MGGRKLKCPVCSNEGEKYAFVTCYVGAIYIKEWLDEEELDEWDRDKVALVTCGKCDFTGLPELFEGGVELPEIKENDLGFYIDRFEGKVGSCIMRGKLYLSDQVVEASQKVHRIYHATSVDELPEVLCDESAQLRELAAARFRELGESANGSGTETGTEYRL